MLDPPVAALLLSRPSMRLQARWQSGHAGDCKSPYVGSIPARASSPEATPLPVGSPIPSQGSGEATSLFQGRRCSQARRAKRSALAESGRARGSCKINSASRLGASSVGSRLTASSAGAGARLRRPQAPNRELALNRGNAARGPRTHAAMLAAPGLGGTVCGVGQPLRTPGICSSPDSIARRSASMPRCISSDISRVRASSFVSRSPKGRLLAPPASSTFAR